MLTLLCIIPVLVAGQVLWVAVVEGGPLRAQGERQANAIVEVPAMRGAILDWSGRVLAVNTARYDVALDPSVEGFTEEEAKAFFENMAGLLGRNASTLRRKVAQRSSPKYVLLERGVSERDKEVIESWEVPGLILHPRFARRYNYRRAAAHVLGHVDADGNGLAGLELQYNDFLRGAPGRRTAKRDRRGVLKASPEDQVLAPEHGQNLVLTVDLVHQAVLEEELARGVAESGARWGTAIAMDPRTGAILAMANVPTYDPNRPAAFPTEARRNRAITDRIEPGSTFKLITAVTAIEQGIVALEDSIETGPGWMMLHGHTLKDTHAYGTIPFIDVIAKSSNIGTAKVAMQIERGIFYQYARNLGFGQNTWVDLPGEVAGRLKKPSEWSGPTLSAMSRGYEVEVTPLQLLVAYSALANGGLLVQPYIVARREDLTGRTVWTARQDSIRRAFKRKTAQRILPAFERVVQAGTARQAQVQGLTVAGKTGTAIKVNDGRYDRGAYRATFVGFFPVEEPEVALLVMMDEPRTSIYGGVVAAPVFQRVSQRWLSSWPHLAAHQEADEEAMAPPPARPMPNVTGQPAAVAEGQLIAAGYRADRTEEARTPVRVVRQRPQAEAPVYPGTRVRLTLAADTTMDTMPDLKGLGVRQAAYWLASRGVDVRIEGHGLVVSQSPRAGAALPARAVLRCRQRMHERQ